MNDSKTSQIAPAIIKAQAQMGNAVKGSNNPFFKSRYADLNSIREAVMPALLENGIAVLQPTIHVDGRNFVQTVLLHTSGETITSMTEIISKEPNNPQAAGSGISYARRYGLQSLLSIGAEDDDGESAMARTAKAGPKADPAVTSSLKADTVARAQAVVARKLMSKEDLLVETKAKGDSVSDAINSMPESAVSVLYKKLGGMLNVK